MKTFRELSELNGRVALVTGGAGHLGRAFCRVLVELGCRVAVVDVQDSALESFTVELNTLRKESSLSLAVDLRDTDAIRRLPNRVVEQWSRLDILVNNAAFVGTSKLPGWGVPFPQQEVEAWRSCLEVNLTAPFVLAQACATPLSSHGTGSIINISSIYGALGPDLTLYEGTKMANPAAYGASKGGLLQLTRYLATVLAPHVRVNAICPGGIARGQADEFVQRYEKRTPMGRMGDEGDFIGTLAYLASDLSRYVTGQVLMVDGGWSAW
ncbi:MAG: SDR family oxidoreductase [Verrucomicrobiaceae bacterium]